MEKSFSIYYDASSQGLGWVLKQEGHVVAYASQQLSVTPTFYKNKNFVQIGVHIKMHIKL
jgi:hypothetical protein